MATRQSSRREWLVIGGLVALSLVPAIAGTARLGSLASGGEVTPENARFFAMPLPVVLHVLGAVPFSLLGAFQFGAGFRRRHRKFHRAAGKFLALCGMMVAISGLWMTLAYPWANNDGMAVYVMRLVFGLGMAFSIVAGVEAIVRRRDLDAHGAWMVRAYAIGMGAGTQVFTHLPWFILIGVAPSEFPRAVMMGAGWVINLLVAEVIIRRRSPRVARVAAAPLVATHSA